MSTLHRSQSSNNLPFSWEDKAALPKIPWESKKLPHEDRPRISWENKPWASKERARVAWEMNKPATVAPERDFLVLPPPPACRFDTGRRRSVHGYSIPLLPRPPLLQPPGSRNSPKKGGTKREEDPFLAAYIECTKTSVKPTKETKRQGVLLGLSCKLSCGVREDGMVRLSQIAHPRDLDSP